MRRALAIGLAAISIALGAADDPAEQLKDPAAERRAEKLFGEFRCVVCQNESVAASNADIAHSMRVLIRQQVGAGKSDAEIRDYMYRRYGDFILLRPRLTPATVLLWGAPFAIVLGGLATLLLRRRKAEPLEKALSKAELARLKALETAAKEDGAR